MFCEALLGEQTIVAVVLGLTPDEEYILVRFFGIEHKIPVEDVSLIADTVSELIVAKTSMSDAEKLDSIHQWLMDRRRSSVVETVPRKKAHANRYASLPQVPRENAHSPQAPTPSRGTPAATLSPSKTKTTVAPQGPPRASPQAAQPPVVSPSYPGCSISLTHGSFVIFFEPNDQIPPRYKAWERATSVRLLDGLVHHVLYRRRTDGSLVEASAAQR